MKRRILFASLMVLIAVAVVLSQGLKQFHDVMSGFEEVPAVSTGASGEFSARISHDETEIAYELSYSGLEGNVTQAHIHIGQAGVNGGVSVFLCGTAVSPGPPGTQTCPQSGTVTGTLTASNVIGPAGQGVSAGEFAELVRAIRAGATYANVHSSKFPGGEVRAQIDPGKGR
jgi:CHRD domain